MDRKVLGALVAVLALGVASCGGSGTLSRAAFTKQALVICKHRAAQLAASQARHRGDFRAGVEEALPAFKKSLTALAALNPAADSKSRLDQLVAIERQQLTRIERALAGHPERQQETSAQLHAQARLRTELGLRRC